MQVIKNKQKQRICKEEDTEKGFVVLLPSCVDLDYFHLATKLFFFLSFKKSYAIITSSVLVNVTNEAGKREFPRAPRGQGKHFGAGQRCEQSNFSPCIWAATQFLQEGREAGTQVVAMESQGEERGQDRLHVPKYDIKNFFSDPQTVPPLHRSNKQPETCSFLAQ